MLNLQRGGHASILLTFLCNFAILATQRGGHGPMAPPECQRWSPRGRPRGHILKSLALASKPQVLENCPVLGLGTALFFEQLKFC